MIAENFIFILIAVLFLVGVVSVSIIVPLLIKIIFFRKLSFNWFLNLSFPLIVGGLIGCLIWNQKIDGYLYYYWDSIIVDYSFLWYTKPTFSTNLDWYAPGVNQATMFLVYFGITISVYLLSGLYAYLRSDKKPQSLKFILLTLATLLGVSLAADFWRSIK